MLKANASCFKMNDRIGKDVYIKFIAKKWLLCRKNKLERLKSYIVPSIIFPPLAMKDQHYLKEELYDLVKSDNTIFDFIQESSTDGIWYWDLDKPEEEWMSPKFWSVLGYDYKEMPHNPSAWQNIINPEDLKMANELFIEHCKNPEIPYHQTIRDTPKNGSIVWIRCSG